jgi:hypothetical protein
MFLCFGRISFIVFAVLLELNLSSLHVLDLVGPYGELKSLDDQPLWQNLSSEEH